MTPYTIGFIGVGRIGSQVARAVIKAGHPIVIALPHQKSYPPVRCPGAISLRKLFVPAARPHQKSNNPYFLSGKRLIRSAPNG